MQPCKKGTCSSGQVCNRKTRICTAKAIKIKKMNLSPSLTYKDKRQYKRQPKPKKSTMKSMIKQLLVRIASSNANTNAEDKYICKEEVDSNNATKFEGLSNDHLIVIKCKLTDPILIELLLAIFQAIYDKNYWHFDKDDIDEWIETVDEFEDYTKAKQDELIQKMNAYDADVWYKMLYNGGISEEYTEFNSVPVPQQTKTKQKIYTIADIIALL